MKATEITIGSLIQTNKGEIIKVASISTKRQHHKVGYHSDGDNCHIKYVRLDQCEGIPLTEDVLKANGFVEKQNTTIFYNIFKLRSGSKLYITYSPEMLLLEVTEVCGYKQLPRYCNFVLSVHEMQNVFRACYFSDLANNFKIE